VAKTADWLGGALRQSRWRRARKPASSECSPSYHTGRFQPRCPVLRARWGCALSPAQAKKRDASMHVFGAFELDTQLRWGPQEA
jgi:hypothetical protein